MYIYWLMLLASLCVMVLSYATPQRCLTIETRTVYRIQYPYALILMLVVVFFVGMRDVVLDTYAYVSSYEQTPTEWKYIFDYVQNVSTGKGFYLIQFLFKNLISESHYVWFLFLAAVSCFCLLRVLYTYSIDLPLTLYLFIANCNFTWLLNGTRQFFAVCILFTFTDWLLCGKKKQYILLALLMTTIHSSAIFVVPVCLFLSAKEFFSKKMWLFSAITIVGTIFSDYVFGIVGLFLDKDYSSSLEEGTGSTFMRLLVAIVPLILSLLGKRIIEARATPSIILAANMSLIGACFSLASTFTNGILVGRMPIYFSIYNLYLLPWLIKNVFDKRSSRLVWWACVVLYGLYFYYQIMIAWKGLPYISHILGIG